jgi:hypothetical protein
MGHKSGWVMKFNQLAKPRMKRYERDAKCPKVTQYEI